MYTVLRTQPFQCLSHCSISELCYIGVRPEKLTAWLANFKE
jgi:hypothetical protein